MLPPDDRIWQHIYVNGTTYFKNVNNGWNTNIYTYIETPGVNFTNILWTAFVPKSFRQKITNPNCKHLKAVQITLVWLSISPIFYKQLFHTKVLCAPFMCLQFGFVIFWQKDFGTKAAHKMLVKLTLGGQSSAIYLNFVHLFNTIVN